jgi:hypothetical protein
VVWDQALPPGSESVVLESAFAIGVGLHLRLRAVTSGRLHRLKVAQPTELVLAGAEMVMRDARYVQSDGDRLPKRAQTAAVVLALTGSGHQTPASSRPERPT